MIIHSYVMSNPDEVDVLGDCLDSLAPFSDRIFVVDGGLGGGTLCHKPRYTTPLNEWAAHATLACRLYTHGPENRYGGEWRGIPFTLLENEFKDPKAQREWTLNEMAKEPDQPNWIVWIDSDEVCSWEFIDGVRPYLESLPSYVTNVCPKWLTLIQDEHHYFPDHSNWLAHARIHQPGAVKWHGAWHEDQQYSGKRVQWPVSIIHTRMLYRRRLYVQRGHPFVKDGWKNAECVPLPNGTASWPKLTWPADEPVIPFDADIREFEGGKYA